MMNVRMTDAQIEALLELLDCDLHLVEMGFEQNQIDEIMGARTALNNAEQDV